MLMEPRETAGRTLPKTESKTQKRILKCGKETTILKRVVGNCNKTMPEAPCLTVLKGPRETASRTLSKESSRGCGKLQQKIDIQLQTTTLDHQNCKSQVIGTLSKSS